MSLQKSRFMLLTVGLQSRCIFISPRPKLTWPPLSSPSRARTSELTARLLHFSNARCILEL